MAKMASVWKHLLAILLLVVLTLDTPAFGSVLSSSARLRRVHKSTYSDGPEATSVQSIAGGRIGTKLARSEGPIATMGRALLASKKTTLATGKSTTTTATTNASTTLRQRVDQAVQMVKARSKEYKMEQEQKRVDRKLRRDEKQQERSLSTPAMASINPHNLQMPDCPTGKVYNGRRCVTMAKTPKAAGRV